MPVQIRRGYADAPQGQVHYRAAGSGPPLLLLHQNGMASECFERLMPLLGESHSVFALDLPGLGASNPPSRPYEVADYAAHVVAAADALGLESMSVFGHHTGVLVGVEIAAAHPARVEALVLEGIPVFETSFDEFAERDPILYEPMSFEQDGRHFQRLWDRIAALGEKAFPRPFDAAALAIIQDEVLSRLVAGDSYREVYRAVFAYDTLARLPLVEAPTLLLAGDSDALAENNAPAAAKLRRSSFKEFSGGSYYTTYVDAEVLAKEILAFLADPGV